MTQTLGATIITNMPKQPIIRMIILLSSLIISCNTKSDNRNEFIRNQIGALNYTVNANNRVLNKNLIKIDSSFSIIRDSTQYVFDEIMTLTDRLDGLDSSSRNEVNRLLINQGHGNRIKKIINRYCEFMTNPGFKVWNIAKKAKTEEMINTDDFIPFDEYHFKDANVNEAVIIVNTLLTEVLNVESRYYAFSLKNEVCN